MKKVFYLALLCAFFISACATPAQSVSLPNTQVPATEVTPVTATPTVMVTPTESAKEIIWPTQGTETTVQVEGLDFGMKLKDPEATYKMILEALIANRENNGKFLWSLLGTQTPTVDQFLNFLKSSKGPDGRAYYMPFTANGVEYKWLSGTGYYDVRYSPAISLREGVYLQDVVFMIFSPAEYNQYKESIDAFLKYNRDGKIWPVSGEKIYSPISVSGLLMTPDGRLVFVQGDLKKTPDFASTNNKDASLGGRDGILGEDDLQKVTAGWLVYTNAAKRYTNPHDRQGQPGYCTFADCHEENGGKPYRRVKESEEIVIFK